MGGNLQNMLGVGRATTIDDSGETQRMQVTEGAAGSGFADRVTDNVRRVTEFGFSSVPPIDSEVVVLRRGGDRSCSIIMGTSHRASRPRDMGPGDAALYDARGASVKLTEEGPVIDAAGMDVLITNATTITLEVGGAFIRIEDGKIYSSGTWEHDGTFKADGIEMTTHTHAGVQAGTASTQGPT